MYTGEDHFDLDKLMAIGDHEATTSTMDAISGEWDSATGFVGLMLDKSLKWQAEDDDEKIAKIMSPDEPVKKIDPYTLNQMYPNIPEAFTDEFGPITAQFMVERQQEKQRNSMISQAGGDSFGMNALRFGTGMAKHITDPAEFLIGLAGGFLAAPLFGSVSAGAAALSARGVMGARMLSGASRAAGYVSRTPWLAEATGDILGNLAIEPAYGLLSDDLGDSYTYEDFMMSVVAAPIGMSVAKNGLKAGFRGMKYVGTKAYNKAFTRAIEQVSTGKTVDIGNVTDEVISRIDNGGSIKYNNIDLGEFNNKEAVYMTGKDVNYATNVSGYDIDGSVSFTSNPNRASGMAIGDDISGTVSQIDMSDLNLMNAAKELDTAAKGKIGKFLEDNGITKPEKLDTLSDTLEAIEKHSETPGAAKDLNTKLSKELNSLGYDGIITKAPEFSGNKLTAQKANSVNVFEAAKDKVKIIGHKKVDLSPMSKKLSYNAKAADTTDLLNREKDFFFDSEASKEYNAIAGVDAESSIKTAGATDVGKNIEAEGNIEVAEMDVSSKTKDVQMKKELSMERLNELDAEGTLTPQAKEIIEEVKQLEADTKTEAEIHKAAIACMRD